MAVALVTGATGFVGACLVPSLLARGWTVRAVTRPGAVAPADGAEPVVVGDLADSSIPESALVGVDVLVHLAGRAHMLRETAVDVEAAYRRANVDATGRLARQAAGAGVQRLVFLSSVKVNGESTDGRAIAADRSLRAGQRGKAGIARHPAAPFTEADAPAPADAYGRSKLAAEQELAAIARTSGLEVVVIRPPLVYGPGVKANFLRLLRLVDRGVPLPFAGVDNRRSLISVWNLCGLITACLGHPAAAGEVFLASDQRDLSTPSLISLIAAAMGRPARLFAAPVSALRVAARLFGQGAALERLVGSLQVDSGSASRLLGWAPSVSVEEGLGRTVAWYLSTRK